MNAEQIKSMLNYAINNNKKLASEGKMPVAYNIEGLAGCGKTSVCKEIAQEHDMNFIRVNLAELSYEEITGYPFLAVMMCKKEDNECMWVSEKMIGFHTEMGWKATGEVKMDYALPKWIHGLNDKPTVLFLDDFTRASNMVMQAIMTIIDEQKHTSWKLPKGSTVILSSNPDNQNFFVTSVDEAQSSRYITWHMNFCEKVWSQWAEKNNVLSSGINFILKNPEIIEGNGNSVNNKGDKLAKGNIRLWTKYFDSLESIKDLSDNIDMVYNIAGTSLPQEHITLFSTFIKDGLDRIKGPFELLQNTKLSLGHFEEVIKKGNNKRSDIAAIISTRLLNYALINGNDEKKYDDKMIETYFDILESEYLNKDLVILSIKKIQNLSRFRGFVKRKKLLTFLTDK